MAGENDYADRRTERHDKPIVLLSSALIQIQKHTIKVISVLLPLKHLKKTVCDVFNVRNKKKTPLKSKRAGQKRESKGGNIGINN